MLDPLILSTDPRDGSGLDKYLPVPPQAPFDPSKATRRRVALRAPSPPHPVCATPRVDEYHPSHSLHNHHDGKSQLVLEVVGVRGMEVEGVGIRAEPTKSTPLRSTQWSPKVVLVGTATYSRARASHDLGTKMDWAASGVSCRRSVGPQPLLGGGEAGRWWLVCRHFVPLPS